MSKIEQCDLFEEQYRTLEELKSLIEYFHWTGGMNADGTPQNEKYQIEFYKDLAFIVQFKDETDENEKIIDNCVELQLVENNLYKIISMNGKTISDIYVDHPDRTAKQVELIQSMMKGELWKK